MDSQNVFSNGIFATEPGQRLLQILLRFADRGFRGLYDRCESVTQDYYQAGLRRVDAWSDDVLQEDIEFVRASFPDFEETLEFCISQHAFDRFRGARSSEAVEPLQFVRSFLKALGEHDALVNGTYFSRSDDVHMRFACMDSARQAMYGLVQPTDVGVELASEVATQTGVGEDAAVSPDDSVSQIGTSVSRATARDERPARRAPSVASVPASSTHSRHDVADDFEILPPAPPLAAPSAVGSTTSSHRGRQVASSRDSHVSVGMKTTRSPRRA